MRLKRVLAAVLALAFMARGAAAFCPPEPREHGCCEKPAPVQPKAPCQEMSCCLALPSAAAPAAQAGQPAVSLPAGVVIIPPFIVARARLAILAGGPPWPRPRSVSDRSPPALLG